MKNLLNSEINFKLSHHQQMLNNLTKTEKLTQHKVPSVLYQKVEDQRLYKN